MIKDLLKQLFAPATVEQRPDNALAAAALLVEIAMADGTLDAAEQARLAKAIGACQSLDPAQVAELLARAQTAQGQATSVYEFTRVINDEFAPEQKFALVCDLWRIAYADGELDKYEEYMIRRLCDLLHVSHGDFIRAKLLARERG